MIEQLLFHRGQFLFFFLTRIYSCTHTHTHTGSHTHTRMHSTRSPLSEIRWASPVASLSLRRLTGQMIGWEAPPPPICRRLINPVTHTRGRSKFVHGLIHTLHLNTHMGSLCGDISFRRQVIGSISMATVQVCCECVRWTHTGDSYMLVFIMHTCSHTAAEGAAMDLSGDTQIWLIGLIGFQRACWARETDTDQITAETPGKLCQRQKEQEAWDARRGKINVSDDMRTGCAGRREHGRRFTFLPWELRRSEWIEEVRMKNVSDV